MSNDERKKYDSQAGIWMQNAYLAKDPQIIGGGDKELVKLTFVLTSRSDRHSDTWLEVAVQDRQADLAKYLKKGDVLGFAGFPATRKWGDDNAKTSVEVVRAEIFTAVSLFCECKERGFTPGASGGGKAASAAPAKKKLTPTKRPVQSLDDDDDRSDS